MMEVQAYENTDKQLWREDDYGGPSIHVTADGLIGINVGGTVIIRDVRVWHRLANEEANKWQNSLSVAPSAPEPDPQWEYTQYLQVLMGVQSVGVDVSKEIRDTVTEIHKFIFKA